METVKATKPEASDKAETTVSLAELCKSLKLDPRLARRTLRAAKVQVEGARWTWKKGSAELGKVTTLLRGSKTK